LEQLNCAHERTYTGNNRPCFCEAKRLPFLAQVLSLERKCNNKSGYVYVCRFGDINAGEGSRFEGGGNTDNRAI